MSDEGKTGPIYIQVAQVLLDCQEPRSIAELAIATGLLPESCARACHRLERSGFVEIVGRSVRTGVTFCWVEGKPMPVDGRGRHGKQLTGIAWSTSRKQRSNLKRLRARKRAKRLSEFVGNVLILRFK